MPVLSAQAAVSIKKAAPVATKSSAGTDGTASLVPTVLGLVTGIMEMNSKQNALSAECIPSTAEINFVNNAMKEWAKTGQTTASAVRTILRREPCAYADGGYATDVKSMAAEGLVACYNHYAGPGNEGMVWGSDPSSNRDYGFPKAGKGTYCKSGAYTCTGNDLVTMSDAYDLFAMIDFGPADYTPAEASMAARLLNKVDDCSSTKISAKKRELWGAFLVNTAGGLGQKTNTGSIMETVGSISQSGGMGALGSLGSIATQFMNK